MVVARFSAAGVYEASAVCYAPHLIDYAARAVAVKPNGSIVLVGYGRDRHASAAVPPTGPSVQYGLRAVVTLPPSGNSTTACGTYSANGTLSLGSSGRRSRRHQPGRHGSRPRARRARLRRGRRPARQPLRGRHLERPRRRLLGAALLRHRGGHARRRIQRGSRQPRRDVAARARAAGRRIGAGSRRVDRPRHPPPLARCSSPRSPPAGRWAHSALAASRAPSSRGGTDSGQAIAVQSDGNILVGGQANLAGKSAFALTRFTAGGARDDTFGNHGQTVTPLGTPAVNGYITGIALSGNTLAVAGRLTDANGLAVVAARYFATGAPPPPPPPPAASTLKVDNVTGTSAHVTGSVNANGTASHYWLEYGTSTSYGTKTDQVAASGTGDVDVGVTITGLSPGTTYHARFVITNGVGTTPGDDVTFTTLGSGGGQGAGAGGKGAKKFCKVPKVKGKKLNPARRKVLAGGCKVKVVYKKSKRPKGLVLAQSRKAGKKLTYRAVVKLTVAVHHPVKKIAKKK